jgi:hypothetical protein
VNVLLTVVWEVKADKKKFGKKFGFLFINPEVRAS